MTINFLIKDNESSCKKIILKDTNKKMIKIINYRIFTILIGFTFSFFTISQTKIEMPPLNPGNTKTTLDTKPSSTTANTSKMPPLNPNNTKATLDTKPSSATANTSKMPPLNPGNTKTTLDTKPSSTTANTSKMPPLNPNNTKATLDTKPSSATANTPKMLPLSPDNKKTILDTKKQIPSPAPINTNKMLPFNPGKTKTIRKPKDSSVSNIFHFKWPHQIGFSIQGAGTLSLTKEKAPQLIQENINNSFLRNHLFLNLQYYLFQFPSFFKWSLKASAGLTRNYDIQSTNFAPLSVGGALHINLINSLIPFIEAGYSVWNIDFKKFSSHFFYWGTGLNISFSLFKPSLQYTLPDEYKVNDMGLILESRWSIYKDSHFIHTLHGGLYLRF